MAVTADQLAAEILAREGVVGQSHDYGRFFFYDSEGIGGAAQMFPMATIPESYASDRWSDPDRDGVFCVNIGLDRDRFVGVFGAKAGDPGARDSRVRDTILPHPDYGAQYFVRVLNPDTVPRQVQVLLDVAHEVAAKRYRGGK